MNTSQSSAHPSANSSTYPSAHSSIDFEVLRYKLIEQQIRPWNVSDAEVLQTLRDVPRENYVPESMKTLAFTDTQLPLPGASQASQVMFEPKMEARILQTIKPSYKDRVLEIGTGSGYMAALLAAFADQVESVEIDPKIASLAEGNLAKNQIKNVKVSQGDGYTGWGTQTYDVICVSGSMPSLPDGLKLQLAVGGKLFVILGEAPVMRATLIERIEPSFFKETALFETLTPCLQSPKVKIESFAF